VVGERCVLATNTSSLPVDALAAALRDPARFVGLHFFNPAPVLPLVEVAAALATSPQVVDAAAAVVERWGKTAVRCAATPGFLVNRVARPFYSEALAVVTERPERVIGLHFFNPVPVQRLVEVIPALVTGDDTLRRTRDFAGQLGKQAIQAPDRSGFVVNALLVPYLLSAVRMVESGSARPDDIDRGMELGCAHPMGPLRLLDLIGLDTAQAVAESMYEEYKEPLYAPPALLRRMVAAGHLGRKSGRGFHTYGD